MESGGINWIGPSSSGKTTMLAVGGSVWGKGASSGGYVLNWRATSNGLEGLAALHSDAALCLDELGQAPGRTIMEASYMLANGMGKSRASQDGSARAIKSWRYMILSTGEKGLAEKIADEGGRVQAGQTVRLIDVPAMQEKGRESLKTFTVMKVPERLPMPSDRLPPQTMVTRHEASSGGCRKIIRRPYLPCIPLSATGSF